MITEIIKSSNKKLVLSKTKSLLESGNIIAFPTETVYGLGGDIFNYSAVDKIYLAKNRQMTNPLAAHIGDLKQMIGLWREIPDDFYKLADKFLPGPLAIIYHKSNQISELVTSGFKTLSVRFPDNEICREIINHYGIALAATSANLSGRPSPINAENVKEDLDGKIPLIVDDGNVQFGMESTVLSLIEETPVIFRQGIISAEEIESVLHKKIMIKDTSEKKQYAPNAKIVEFLAEYELYNFIDTNFLTNFVILSELNLNNSEVRELKNETLFDEFRKADKSKIDYILILYKNDSENRLLMEKIKLAVNQQKKNG